MDSTQSMPLTLVVNAGGASLRMGQHKALLPVPPAGKPLVVHVIEALRSLRLSELVVVANDPAVAEAVAGRRGVRCVADAWSGSGPLAGIAAGLATCPGWAAVIGCDMPLVNAAVIELLAQVAQETDAAGVRRWDAVVPLIRKRTQTMHALYHRAILPVIEEMVSFKPIAFVQALTLACRSASGRSALYLQQSASKAASHSSPSMRAMVPSAMTETKREV